MTQVREGFRDACAELRCNIAALVLQACVLAPERRAMKADFPEILYAEVQSPSGRSAVGAEPDGRTAAGCRTVSAAAG